MRIGVLGGSFDPPHLGHLKFALSALDQLDLEEVMFVPNFRNPLKRKGSQTPAKHRLEMVSRLAAKFATFSVSDIEVRRAGPSYTVETMTELTLVRPGDYWFLLGADAARRLPEWKQPERLIRLCRLGVALRPPLTETQVLARFSAEFKAAVDLVKMEPVDISSTDIRDRIARGTSVAPWVAPEVIDYIQQHKLYRS